MQSRTELKSRACRRHTVNSKYRLDTKDTKEQVETCRIGKITILAHEGNKSVPDLDLEIKGAPVIQTLGKGAARSPKEFFRPFGPQFGLKIRGGGRGGGLPGPLPWIRHWISLQWRMTSVWIFSLFFRHGNGTRLNPIDDKPFTSHPPHETVHPTGVYTLVFSKRCGLFYVLSESYRHKYWALETR